MNDSQLEGFREIANAMLGNNRNWVWSCDPSQWSPCHTLNGVTEKRAREWQKKFGGTCAPMKSIDADTNGAKGGN